MMIQWLKRNQNSLSLLALTLLVILLRLPFVEQPFDNDSAANAYHARLILRGEPLYGSHHPIHHLPGVYYVYALILRLLGDSTASLKIGLMLWQVVTMWLLYYLAKFLHGQRLAILAALFYSFLSADIYLLGMTAETELFVNLPRIASIFALLYLRHKQAPAWQFSLVGFLGVICFWFKAIYLSTFILAILIEFEARPFSLTKTTQRLIWVGVGALAGAVPVVAYFATQGLLTDLGQVFTFGQRYVSTNTCITTTDLFSPIWLFYPAIGFTNYNIVLFVLSLCGGFMLIKRRNHPDLVLLKYIAYWYLLAYAEALPARMYRPYYFQLIIPPLALVAAWFLLDLYQLFRQLLPKRAVYGALGGLTLWAIGITTYHNFNYYAHYAAYRLGQETFATFITDGFAQPNYNLLELADLAQYIQNHTTPEDYVYYWSGDVQLYYLADRHAPTKVIWVCYLGTMESAQQIFIPQTKYIVIPQKVFAAPRQPATASPSYHALPVWFDEYLLRDFTLETTLHEQQIYRRIAP